jgi:hypothetical protein
VSGPKTTAERVASLRERRLKKGLVRLEFWVPAKLVKQVRDYVRRMTADSGDVVPSKAPSRAK